MTIYYVRGYEYQLRADYRCETSIRGFTFSCDYLTLNANGWLDIRKGYAWDGPSGPAFDTRNFMRGSLVHDALYQLLRAGVLPQEYRKAADLELDLILKQDGMNALRRAWVYTGLRVGGAPSAAPAEEIVLEAP